MPGIAESQFYTLGLEGSAAVHSPENSDYSHFLAMAYQSVEPERRHLFNPGDRAVVEDCEQAFRDAAAIWEPNNVAYPRRVVVDYWGKLETPRSPQPEAVARSATAWVTPVVAYAKLVQRYYGDEQPFRAKDQAWRQAHMPTVARRLSRRLGLSAPASPLTNSGKPELELMELVVAEEFRNRGVGLVAVHAALYYADPAAALFSRVTAESSLVGAYEQFGMEQTGRSAIEEATGRYVVQLVGKVGEVRQAVGSRMIQKGIVPPAAEV